MRAQTKKEVIIENYHDINVSDSYRWLEDIHSDKTKKWVKEQNKNTEEYLATYFGQDQVKSRLTELTDYPKYSIPTKIGDYYYFYYNKGLQNQAIYYRSKSVDGKNKEIVLDPNTFSSEGTAAISDIRFSPSGSILAYGMSFNGSDWQTVKIKNLDSMEDYPDELKWTKFNEIAWTEDEQGFYYDCYPEEASETETDSNFHNKTYYHYLKTTQQEDELIYEMPERKKLAFKPTISDDYRYLILTVTDGTEPKSGIYYKDLSREDQFQTLIKERQDDYRFLGNEAELFYFYTNYNAPKGRVIAIDLANPDKENWIEILAEKESTISEVNIINNSLVVVTMENAQDQLTIYNFNGKKTKSLSLPNCITITGISGKKTGSELFASYSSYLSTEQIIHYDLEEDNLAFIFKTKNNLPSMEDFETKQIFYKSKDGTDISMFITHKKDIKLTGDHPVLLFGYGGYNISLKPKYSPSHQLWLEAGGIYAEANLRGGGEYGEAWHQDGILSKKQNVFDDFISAAEWLIRHNYTNSNLLAIMGRSNGGLLVGACINQRPDLFGAGISMVPVTDSLRYHKFTVGGFWTSEFGNAEENKEDFQWLYRYSPLHNVKENAIYPPLLITTGDHDDRVSPLHAYKFTAELQEKQQDHNPILLRVDTNAGHGGGKSITKIINEEADILSFIFKQFKMQI